MMKRKIFFFSWGLVLMGFGALAAPPPPPPSSALPPPQSPPPPPPREKPLSPDIGLKDLVYGCPVCKGKGKLVLSPPDKGQFAGRAESRAHWDVKSVCPICEGHGRIKKYRTFLKMGQEDGSLMPCRACGWSGCKECRRCKGAGVMFCKYPHCESGWIITKSEQYMSGKKRKPPSVTPCPECRGVGKVRCSECGGKGGTPCRKCHGEGRYLKGKK